MILLYIILYKNRNKYYHFVIFNPYNVGLTYNLYEKAPKKNLLGFLTTIRPLQMHLGKDNILPRKKG